MLDTRQSAMLCAGGALFWLGDVAWIRLAPAFVLDPFWGNIGFLLSVPLAVLCVRVCRRLAGLGGTQLVPGATLLVVVAALLHALALRWASALYGSDYAGRLGSAWLLWIYGLILGCALMLGARSLRVPVGDEERATGPASPGAGPRGVGRRDG